MSGREESSIIRKDAPTATAIELSPFAILSLSLRDNRQRIMEAAEEKGLFLESEVCSRARSNLINPRNRLSIELAWLPGVSPKRALELIGSVRHNPEGLIKNPQIEPLALANLIASVTELLDARLKASELANWIIALANAGEKVDPEKTRRLVNEDRLVSGFPEIGSIDLVEQEITDRRKHFKEAVIQLLNRLDSDKLIEVTTAIVEASTSGGTKHSATLIDEVVDSYQLETEGMLQAQALKIVEIIDCAKNSASKGEDVVLFIFDSVKKMTLEWTRVARPIQLGLKSRGLEHNLSSQLGRRIRGLAVDVTNEHGLLDTAREITDFLGNIFTELPEFSANLEDDVQALQGLFRQRKEAETHDEEWRESISREIEMGTIFKKKFKISPDGVSWNGKNYSLNEITRVRWGGTRHSVNGIPTGTTFQIAFGNNSSEAVLHINNRNIFSMIIESLWKAVGIRLSMSLLEALKAGAKLRFGDAVVDDLGVELTQHNFFSSKRSYWPWSKVRIWSSNGNFVIGSSEDKKSYSQISYVNVSNAHVLENCIGVAFKNFKGRLSSLID
jgi:hypothetical protein